MISQQSLPALDPSVEVVTDGYGPVVALAHGAGGGVRANFGQLITGLCATRRLVGANYPGSGSTPGNEQPLTLEGLAETLVAAAAAEGTGPLPVVGYSLGAAVAITAALRYPQHVSGLVLAAGFPCVDGQLATMATAWQGLHAAGAWDALAALQVNACLPGHVFSGMGPRARRVALEVTRAGYPAGGAAQIRVAATTDLVGRLRELEVPTLVVVTGADRLVHPATQYRLAEGISGAEVVELRGAGHALDVDEAQAWAEHTRAFLARRGI